MSGKVRLLSAAINPTTQLGQVRLSIGNDTRLRVGASGRGNRFALMARRASDNALVLLVVDPNFGVISHTKVTIRPLPVRMTGVVLKENGWIYVGTSGTAPYRVFSPTYATTLN